MISINPAPADLACAPAVPAEAGPLASFHPLILAVCRETRRFPDGDPVELGLGIRGAALGAAEAVLAGCQLRRTHRVPMGFATALVESVHRLRELAYCIEIARRLGYLSAERVAELLALHTGAARAVSALADRGLNPGAARAGGRKTGPRSLPDSSYPGRPGDRR